VLLPAQRHDKVPHFLHHAERLCVKTRGEDDAPRRARGWTPIEASALIMAAYGAKRTLRLDIR
jgi:hypothetical protein